MIQVYHGDGKGKTTASIGLAIRAMGAGRKVVFAQFLKGGETGELHIFEVLENIKVIRNKKDLGFVSAMSQEEKKEVTQMHNENMKEAISLIKSGWADVIILDELTYPYTLGLIDREMVKDFVEGCKEDVELIITGRNPDPLFLEKADYITNMQCQRHPYEKNIKARRGIEY